jgi:hypothetical protein
VSFTRSRASLRACGGVRETRCDRLLTLPPLRLRVTFPLLPCTALIEHRHFPTNFEQRGGLLIYACPSDHVKQNTIFLHSSVRTRLYTRNAVHYVVSLGRQKDELEIPRLD